MSGDFKPNLTMISDEEANSSTIREIQKRRTKKPDAALASFADQQLDERPD